MLLIYEGVKMLINSVKKEYVEKYLKMIKATKSEKTYRSYKEKLDKFLSKENGEMEVNDYIVKQPTSIQQILKLLLKKIYEFNKDVFNEVIEVKKHNSVSYEALSEADVKLVKSKMYGIGNGELNFRESFVVLVLLNTGIRREAQNIICTLFNFCIVIFCNCNYFRTSCFYLSNICNHFIISRIF